MLDSQLLESTQQRPVCPLAHHQSESNNGGGRNDTRVRLTLRRYRTCSASLLWAIQALHEAASSNIRIGLTKLSRLEGIRTLGGPGERRFWRSLA